MSTSEMRRSDTADERADSEWSSNGVRPDDSSPIIDRAGTPVRVDTAWAPRRWLKLDAETVNIAVARRYVRRSLGELLPLDRLEMAFVETLTADLELAASELVTNAVEHGEGRSLELAVSCDRQAVALEVVSHGGVERVGPAQEWQVSDVESVTGRGLGIVRAVSDRVAVTRHTDNLTIRIERDLPTP